MRIRAGDVAFWILILATFAVILWLLSGSPTVENAIITIGLFIISSELLLWRKYFEADKHTTVGFMRVKNDLDIIKKDVNDLRNEVNDKLDRIDNKIK